MTWFVGLMCIGLGVIGGLAVLGLTSPSHVCQRIRYGPATVSVDTRGCFSARSPLSLAVGSGWAGTPAMFTQFHLRNATQEKPRGATPVYTLAGPAKVAYVDCPVGLFCLVEMRRPHGAWVVSKRYFVSSSHGVPLRIRMLIEPPEPTVLDHHQLLIAGPATGHVYFNAIARGLLAGETSPSRIEDLPDGILGFKSK